MCYICRQEINISNLFDFYEIPICLHFSFVLPVSILYGYCSLLSFYGNFICYLNKHEIYIVCCISMDQHICVYTTIDQPHSSFVLPISSLYGIKVIGNLWKINILPVRKINRRIFGLFCMRYPYTLNNSSHKQT